MNEIMDIQQVCEYLRIKPITAYKYAERGKLPGFKVGTLWRFRRSAIERWIAKQEKDTMRGRG